MDRNIKHQNRNRNKKDHRGGGKGQKKKEEEEEDVPQELKDEAARLGCEVWEVEQVKAKMEQEGSDDSGSEGKK